MMRIPDFSKRCKDLGLKLSSLQRVEKLLDKEGGSLFLIGGNVRDLILKKRISSKPDTVSDLPINKIIECLKDHKIINTKQGLKHGSVVIYINKNLSIDLTSMRVDKKTDGRWAETTETDNIELDAQRRDFTMNAIYCDMSGNIIDPLKGIKDLKKLKVKFIGSPEQRIKEDFLRILRFLRFSLGLSGSLDKKGLDACKKLKKNLRTLSFERRIQELKKILLLPNIENKKLLKEIKNILEFSIESKITIKNFERLCQIEKTFKNQSFLRRIKFLLRNTHKEKLKILNKFSKLEKRRVLEEIKLPQNNYKKFNYLLYYNDKDVIYDKLIEDFSEKKISQSFFMKLFKITNNFVKKKNPINGEDLIRLGFENKREFNNVLRNFEEWWIENNFLPKKKECLNFLKKSLPSS